MVIRFLKIEWINRNISLASFLCWMNHLTMPVMDCRQNTFSFHYFEMSNHFSIFIYLEQVLLLLVTSVVSDSVWPHRWQPTRLPRPWDSPGKNTGVGCHFLLQCMKVKSESEVAQSCLTLSDPMDCSLPGSSIHGILQARELEWGAIAFSENRCYL